MSVPESLRRSIEGIATARGCTVPEYVKYLMIDASERQPVKRGPVHYTFHEDPIHQRWHQQIIDAAGRVEYTGKEYHSVEEARDDCQAMNRTTAAANGGRRSRRPEAPPPHTDRRGE